MKKIIVFLICSLSLALVLQAQYFEATGTFKVVSAPAQSPFIPGSYKIDRDSLPQYFVLTAVQGYDSTRFLPPTPAASAFSSKRDFALLYSTGWNLATGVPIGIKFATSDTLANIVRDRDNVPDLIFSRFEYLGGSGYQGPVIKVVVQRVVRVD